MDKIIEREIDFVKLIQDLKKKSVSCAKALAYCSNKQYLGEVYEEK